MKKKIFSAGFALLAAMLFSFSSFAYWVYYDGDTPPENGIPVNVEVIGSPGIFGDFNLSDILVVDAYTGDNIPVILQPGNHNLNLVVVGGYDGQTNFTISSQHQPGGIIGVVYTNTNYQLVLRYAN